MTDQKVLTIVTVTILNSDGQSECGSSEVDEYNDLDQAIDNAKETAADRFNDQGYSALETRMVVNVNKVPAPTLPSTTVTATLPVQPMDGAETVVTTTIE